MIADYIGRTVQIFCQDSKRNISIWIIKVKDVWAGKVRANCYQVGAPRVFSEAQIIDV
jgi:hypothetical protein